MNAIKCKFLLVAATFALIANPVFSFGQYSDSGKGPHLKILTWNIYMLPRLLVHTGQVQRAKQIANILRTQDADIIVFEEAFDGKARRIIRAGLADMYPYESGDPRKDVFWKGSCGVWIMSKVQVTMKKQIFFKKAAGTDWLACKGAVLVDGVDSGFHFQLIGTHLQSDPSSGKNVQEIRKIQYEQIRKELLEPYTRENVPQFVAGDFNTVQADSGNHRQMVDSLKLSQCMVEGGKCYSYDYGHNDMIEGPVCKPQLIDYIFYSKLMYPALQGKMHIVVFRKKWDARHIDLSDHYAVTAEFNLPANSKCVRK